MMDWNTILKTLLSNRMGLLTKTEAVNIIKTIIRCEQEFFDEKSENVQFFMAFTALAAENLSHCKLVCHSHLPQLQDACNILIRFILHALPKASTFEIKWLLHALKCLCEANSNPKSNATTIANNAATTMNFSATLVHFDYNSVVTFLRTCKYPDTVISNVEKDTTQKTEAKPPRSDFSTIILKQLSAPLEPNKFIWTSLSEENADCSDFFATNNVSYFHSLNGVETVLNVCLKLPCFGSFRQKYEATISSAGTPTLEFPLTSVDALKIKNEISQMSVDISILWQVLNMQLMTQPLTAEQIIKLSKCSISTLYIGMSVCIACSVLSMSNTSSTTSNTSLKTARENNEMNDADDHARFVVDKAIEIYTTISEILKQNGRDYIYRNNLCCGSWVLVTGIQAVLGATGAPTNINSKAQASTSQANVAYTSLPRVNLFKVQQGFGVLNLAMANQCIKMLHELIDDLKLETTLENVDSFPEPINFDVLKPHTALHRVFHILNTVTFHQLFTFLATVSYRKSCALKRSLAKDRTVELEPTSYSDSTTFFNDSLSCSDNSEDDSESFFGNWFKETLSPEANEYEANNLTEDMASSQEARPLKSNLIVDEPHEYLDLAAKIFKLLESLHAHKHASIQHYVKICLSEQQMVLLANTLKDLDRESMKNEIEVNVSANWQTAMLGFSSAVSCYLHNLISTGLLSENLQTNLLQHLNLSPWSTENDCWPLQLYTSSLSVLVQILLLKPTQEKEAACLWIWHRLINTLVEKVCAQSGVLALNGDYEDLNIEHSQLLLLLFHSLNLMQKKSILLLTAGGVIRCAEVCRNISSTSPMYNSQIMCLSRLLLFLEYLMKHLYNAPVELLDQVSWHLFNSSIISNNQKQTDLYNKMKSKSFCYNDIEQPFRASPSVYASNINPTFYSLTVLESNLYSEFKLDGLAWNFILCTPDKLKYPLLVDALIDILLVVNMSQFADNAHAYGAMKYCFTICWKLLLGLPPSSQHVEALMQPIAPNLHSLLWSIRCSSSTAKFLISSSLIKQGIYTQLAQNMWNDICAQVCGLPSTIRQTMLGLTQFIEITQSNRPTFSHILLLDAVIARMLAVVRLVKEQPQRAIENIDEDKEAIANETETETETTTMTNEKQVAASVETPTVKEDKSVPELCCNILQLLINTYNAIMDTLRANMREELSEIGRSEHMEIVLRLTGKHSVARRLTFAVWKHLPQRDCEIMNDDWLKCLEVDEISVSEPNLKVEAYTLNTIQAHLKGLMRNLNVREYYCQTNSLKHLLLSILNLIKEVIPMAMDDAQFGQKIEPLTDILVATMLDVRFTCLAKAAENCLITLKGEQQFYTLYFDYTLKYLYALIMELCEAMRSTVKAADQNTPQDLIAFRESMLTASLRTMSTLIDVEGGLPALHKFFVAGSVSNLVELLLCYTGTNIQLAYVREHLQFFEKLFRHAATEGSKAIISMQNLRTCFSSLTYVEEERIKLWLKNTIFDHREKVAVEKQEIETDKAAKHDSTPSSNAQTPTNLPKKKDTREIVEDMDVDDVVQVNVWSQQNCLSEQQKDASADKVEESFERNGVLLLRLIKYLCNDDSQTLGNVCMLLFEALLKLGETLFPPLLDSTDFTDLLEIMITLADTAKINGHIKLFKASVLWLKFATSSIETFNMESANKLENISAILLYFTELLQSIGCKGNLLSNNFDDDILTPLDTDEITLMGVEDEFEDDNTTMSFEDDDENFNNKLCTFTQTQKEFMNQHWYHCHTCNMVNTVGVCSVCARVCHKSHDVSYAKYGNFFCDCGAKEDGSCQAITRRTGKITTTLTNTINSESTLSAICNEKNLRNISTASERLHERVEQLSKLLAGGQTQLQNSEQWLIIVQCILDFLDVLLPVIHDNCALNSNVGCHNRAQLALQKLHDIAHLTFVHKEQLFVPTLGSQEGAFENVRMSYAGDQGQTIKQLISSGLVRRVTLCCLSAPQGKRQHLAVTLEKNKVTILQLSTLLKQADVAKRKLTLTQLAAAPINCTVLSLSPNPVNEDCLAVCGLKECHVLTFANTGATNEHIVITPQLENGNFIKKALWLPGSQTMLALVTADYVKIYDLSLDSYSPQYYFLLAVGKIRDCTFVYQHGGIYFIVIIASSGYIYYQMLDQQSLAKHGDFYVTNTLELMHEHINEDSGQLNGGGVSIYYSHQLQLLFFSHSNGRNFMAPLTDVDKGVGPPLMLETSASSSKSAAAASANKAQTSQALCQWTEIAGHPGIVCAMLQNSNNPIIYMITPQHISYQEIKAQNTKTRIMDMVAIRHIVNEVEKTTLILLCEDGSLRIFTAQPEYTNYWLTPQIQPRDNQLKYFTNSAKKKRSKAANQLMQQQQHEKSTIISTGANNACVFPIDYFEHCTLLSDIEFAGNDLLQIYNKQKLKTRLLSAGMYVVCIKPNGFTLEIYNNDANMAIVGIRVLLGSQDVLRAPQNVNILGRIVNTPVRRARWFDIPLTRDEILQSDKCLKVVFGKSQDPENICILDNIEVYGKSKELLVWPDDTDESANTATTLATTNNALKANRNNNVADCINAINPNVDNQLEKLLSNLLAVLDSALQLISNQNCANIKKKALDIASDLLLLPTTLSLQLQTRHILATLFANRTAYHNYKDHVILNYAYGELKKMEAKAMHAEFVLDIDPEHFYRLLFLVRSVASARPQIFVKMCTEMQYFDIVSQIKLCVEQLYQVTPQLGEPTSIVRRGLCHPDISVHYLTEIIYCCALCDTNQVQCMTKYLLDLLLNKSPVISHSAKDALTFLLGTKVKRRKAATSAISPNTETQIPDNAGTTSQAEYVSEENAAGEQQLLNLDAVLGLRQSIGLQADADEDAIMDLAIALSLQQHGGDNLPRNMADANVSHAASASQAGSDDDEASNIATDGSTLRTSPAEPAGSGGSESGGSGVESIGEQSGRSSSYGDPTNSTPPRLVMSASVKQNTEEVASTSKTEVRDEPVERTTTSEANGAWDDGNAAKLYELRLTILESIMQNIQLLDNCNGVQAIPLAQVILMLVLDLNANSEKDVKLLNDLIMTLIEYVGINAGNTANFMKDQNAKNEVRLVILCLFGVLMGKTKAKHTGGTSSPPLQFKDNATFVASTTASIMSNNGSFEFCMNILESLLQHWKNGSIEAAAVTPSALNRSAVVGVSASGSNTATAKNIQQHLLKTVRTGPKPDISNLIPHNYIKNYPDIFDNYEGLLTEICVRLPYQIIRLTMVHPGVFDGYNSFCESMTYTLCEYMMLNINALLRRQVRKLLMYICGSKEKFRMYRDAHSLDVHFNYVMNTCGLHNTKNLILKNKNMPILNYDSLVEITEHLRNCLEIAQLRTGNWQKFCLMHENVIPVLIEIACYKLDDGISPIVLQLLEAALCNTVQAVKQTTTPNIQNNTNVNVNEPASGAECTLNKLRTERAKSEEIPENGHDSKFDPVHCSTFVHQIFRFVSDSLLNKFIRLFLLESNTSSIRWQAHAIVYALYDHGNERQKQKLITVLWFIWPLVRNFGRRAAQFVDILGYLTLNTRSIAHKLAEYTQMAISGLRLQNELLAKHPNATIYATLEQILQMNGYYLESEPCLVCNNPEIPFSNIKLPSIKSDSKFTTTTMIVKLVQSHTISKLIVRIADLKRTKMVRTINIYYNNRTVQAVVELKNRPALWNKARSVTLQSGQTEVKIEFSLPITACNLMIEYADFYETVTGSSENLQCPRCSAAVPAYPGVCSNCGENVFQCHKCRAINYDEKDPFLCHSCGFCKYAKFDFSIYGRMCCSVDPIETAEDRAKTVQVIHSSLERADRIYRQLQTNQQMLELLIQKVIERRGPDRAVDENMSAVHSTSQVNKVIQLLAQKYCIESRASFEELSKIVQKVKACRSELVAYDQNQEGRQTQNQMAIDVRDNFSANRCYGCALASMEQCLTLLRAMASNADCRVVLYNQGLVKELAVNNLRRGTSQIQDDVRNLLVLLTKNNKDACISLLNLISERVKTALMGAFPLANLDSVVYHEMTLLEVLVGQDEFCWEHKVKVVFQLFFLTSRFRHGPIMSVLQPCLRILHTLLLPIASYNKVSRERNNYENSTLLPLEGLTIDYKKWLAEDTFHTYNQWKSRMPNKYKQYASKSTKYNKKEQNTGKFASLYWRETFLSEKYARKWRQRVLNKKLPQQPMIFNSNWLQPIMFNTSSRFSRQLACSLVTALSNSYECKRELLNMLTGFLQHVGEYGEASGEFLSLFKTLATETPWRQYLAMRGVPNQVTQFLHAEIKKIHHLEETTLSSDLAQGYALRQFVDLLALFLESAVIRQTYKTRLLGPVLEGYLSLRKLIIQRTHYIDDAQEKLLEMLEDMTSGTEEETCAFMGILINTVESSPIDDIKTPVFIFERLYSIIHPEEFDETEFFMSLEKDPQQEDFLQGRMLGNPYGSNEVGLGPLMRDVKNKICTDCELIALLEDDNGMELLVNNKIISLDLPVKDVYKKVWLAEGGERDAMRIVYRMRGLLGDATEEFVETLNNKRNEEVDTEQLYRLANVLADCNGLKVMLQRLSNLQNISRTRELLQVLLKLFLICVKVRRCQEVLCDPKLGAINTLLQVLQLCLQTESDSTQAVITEQLLEIIETILSKAASDSLDSFLQFSLTFGGSEYICSLISYTDCANLRNNAAVLRHLIHVLAALVYGNEIKMSLLCAHFVDILNFERFDAEHTSEEEFKMELFCLLTAQIENNCIGATLKDYIIRLGIVDRAIEYIVRHAPCVKPTLLRTDSDELKEFISRPSLKYVLRFLTGLAHKHEDTQLAISKNIIPIIHRLEQVSSDEHVGSLAENLLEALCTDEATALRVQEVRDFTRAEKKRLAMATREKQLDALGMRTNEKGQVTAKGAILQKIEKLRDETGLICFICREGYACQPAKVLGIYTFTKRCSVEEFELKARKTMGYSTVTHFNVVHVDCHTSAIRLARGRDEWERASLQNANTRCNGLLPLWGPDVTEAAFSACMTRHSSYMQESTQRCEVSFSTSIHDLKMLLMRFAWERSFHEDAGGGGPQSNMHFVPYLLFYAVYLLLSSRSASRDSKSLANYLQAQASDKWLESAYEVEGPLYMLTMSLALHSFEQWQANKLAHLRRLLAIAHVRHVSPTSLCTTAQLSRDQLQIKNYSAYKPYLMLWALLDLIYNQLFKAVVAPKEEDWPIALFDYIRKNDEIMLKSTDTMLSTFTDEFLPCTSFDEFCDVAGLLHTIETPTQYLEELFNQLVVPAESSSGAQSTTA